MERHFRAWKVDQRRPFAKTYDRQSVTFAFLIGTNADGLTRVHNLLIKLQVCITNNGRCPAGQDMKLLGPTPLEP